MLHLTESHGGGSGVTSNGALAGRDRRAPRRLRCIGGCENHLPTHSRAINERKVWKVNVNKLCLVALYSIFFCLSFALHTHLALTVYRRPLRGHLRLYSTATSEIMLCGI